ncbi:MAG: co-chaperone GroES [Candidatus Gracilibacteria bacterium]|jgi:chaperonin GroES
MSKIVPTLDHVVVEPIEEEFTSKSGIIIPETASKEKPMKGKVIAVGEGKFDEDGKRVPMEVKVGDIVLFSKYGPTEVKVDGKEVLILSASDIFAKIN